MRDPQTKFDAFISYRRSDGSAVAHWLRRELQAFRVPSALRERFGRPLKVYLDTAFERGSPDFFEGTIRPNLLASRWLLVVATPDARLRTGTEDWIQREVAEFAAGPNGRNVVAVRGAGDFDDPLPADLVQRFPRIEIVDLRGAGRLSFLNPVRAARLSAEKLKLVAPLLDLPDEEMPRLRQEEERRQQTRLGGTVGATLGVVTAVAGLSVWALQSQYRAVRALEDGMFATGSMVVQASGLAQGLNPEADRTRRLLIAQGCDLLDNLRQGAEREPTIDSLITCQLERAGARQRALEPALAERVLQDAVATAQDRHKRTGRTDAARYLLRANETLVEHYRNAKRANEATMEEDRLLSRLSYLQSAHPSEERFLDAEAVIHRRRAEAWSASGAIDKARDSYETAAAIMDRLLALPGVSDPGQALALAAQDYAEAARMRDQLRDAAGAAAHFRKVAEIVGRIAAGSLSAESLRLGAVAHAHVADFERRNGNVREADIRRRAALDYLGRIKAARDASEDLKSKARALEAALASQGQ